MLAPVFQVLAEAFWHMALLPLAVVLWKRPGDRRYWLVAVGFAVSWFADAGTLLIGRSWEFTHFFPSVQLGIFAYALGSVLVPNRISLAVTIKPSYA